MYDQLILVKANLVGNFATLAIAFLISVIGVISGALNINGLLIILLHLIFGIGFGYYLYKLKWDQSTRAKQKLINSGYN